jgi:hypothetical protein
VKTLKIHLENEILTGRILMNINKIRLQHNLIDNNTKIITSRHMGSEEIIFNIVLTVLA